MRIFDLYLEGKSYQAIANIFNKEKILGKENWYDSHFSKILTNEVYKGDYLLGRKTKHPQYFEDVVPAIVSKAKWESCQSQKLRNARHYERTATYLFTNKLKCPSCNNFLGGAASTKPNGNKYYYYKCSKCKTNISEKIVEEKLIIEIIAILQYDELVNKYFTPFIKSKLSQEKCDYEKEIKDLDKQTDRIKTAYIKGIVKIDEFDKELKHIDYLKQNFEEKLREQKQYENLNFTVDDLMIIKDKQRIEMILFPDIAVNLLNWDMYSKEDKQRIIAKYIDNIEVIRENNEIKIINTNFRDTLFIDILENHRNYQTPIEIPIFVDNNNLHIPMTIGHKTKEQALKYVEKLRLFYDVDYYEKTFEEEEAEITIPIQNETSGIIRIIPLQEKKYYDDDKLNLGIITLDTKVIRGTVDKADMPRE